MGARSDDWRASSGRSAPVPPFGGRRAREERRGAASALGSDDFSGLSRAQSRRDAPSNRQRDTAPGVLGDQALFPVRPRLPLRAYHAGAPEHRTGSKRSGSAQSSGSLPAKWTMASGARGQPENRTVIARARLGDARATADPCVGWFGSRPAPCWDPTRTPEIRSMLIERHRDAVREAVSIAVGSGRTSSHGRLAKRGLRLKARSRPHPRFALSEARREYGTARYRGDLGSAKRQIGVRSRNR